MEKDCSLSELIGVLCPRLPGSEKLGSYPWFRPIEFPAPSVQDKLVFDGARSNPEPKRPKFSTHIAQAQNASTNACTLVQILPTYVVRLKCSAVPQRYGARLDLFGQTRTIGHKYADTGSASKVARAALRFLKVDSDGRWYVDQQLVAQCPSLSTQSALIWNSKWTTKSEVQVVQLLHHFARKQNHNNALIKLANSGPSQNVEQRARSTSSSSSQPQERNVSNQRAHINQIDQNRSHCHKSDKKRERCSQCTQTSC